MGSKNMERKLKNKYILINVMFTLALALSSVILDLFLKESGFSYFTINNFDFIFWIGIFLFEIPCGFIADLIPTKYVLMIAALSKGLCILMILLSGHIGASFVYLGAVIAAFGESMKSETAEAWLVNEVKKTGRESEHFFERTYSKSHVYTSAIDLVSGYIGAKLFIVFSGNLSLVLSIVFYLITTIVCFFIFSSSENENKKENNQIQWQLNSELKNLVKEFKNNQFFKRTCLLFLPFIIVTTAPFNQWTLAFDNKNVIITVAEIYVFVKIASMIGSQFSSKFIDKAGNLYNLYFLLTGLLIASVIIVSVFNYYYLKIIFFLLHVSLTSIIEVIKFKLLNQSIESKRTTFLSIFNTFESIVTILILGLLGILTELLGIYSSWFIFSVSSLIILLILFKQNRYEMQKAKG